MAERPWRGVVRVEEHVGKFAPWRVELVADGYGTIAWCRSGPLANAIADLLNCPTPTGLSERDVELLESQAAEIVRLREEIERLRENRKEWHGRNSRMVAEYNSMMEKLATAERENECLLKSVAHESDRVCDLRGRLTDAERERDDARRGWYESSEEWKQDVRRIAYHHRQQWGRELWLACLLEAMRQLWCDALIQAAQAIALREENP